MAEDMKHVFEECLKQGNFPPAWRRAKLVLLPKEDKPEDLPTSYRPICLLDEAGKILERIIANRLVRHLSREGPDLSTEQYGFRGGRSTIDAILRVRSISEATIEDGEVLLTVSLDIRNAFNTLPWKWIAAALEHHGVPRYLSAMIRDYFRDRILEYVDMDGSVQERGIGCGVSQGSVLGPLLWNLAYDHVLRCPLPPRQHCRLLCRRHISACRGKELGEATATANLAMANVVRSIHALGLEVAAQKTESVFFHDGSHGPPPPAFIRVGEARVQLSGSIKYLGLQLDATWSFGEHFRRLAPRVERVFMALCRLLPNLGGPGGRVRRIYAAVVGSVALYGAPVWAEDVAPTRRLRDLRRMQRRAAIRAARGYRTISHAAATVLSGMPPFDLAAQMYKQMYKRVREVRETGTPITGRVRRIIKDQARRSLLLQWQQELEDPHIAGKRTVEAIRPHLPDWIDGVQREGITYRMTQVLTGHGCFGEYLCRIGKERTERCHHCACPCDSAQHTLETCPAWAAERTDLVAAVGADLTLSTIITAMVERVEAWRAVSSFCGKVMRQKADAERVRRGEGGRCAATQNPQRDGGSMPPPTGAPPQRRGGRRNPHPPPRVIRGG